MSVTVYTSPACMQCEATKRRMKKRGIHYRPVDLSQDPEALEHVKSLGFNQVPVIVAGEESWSGYRPDRIDALSAKPALAAA